MEKLVRNQPSSEFVLDDSGTTWIGAFDPDYNRSLPFPFVTDVRILRADQANREGVGANFRFGGPGGYRHADLPAGTYRVVSGGTSTVWIAVCD